MQNGSVFAYTFSSDDIETASISRHILASGFTPSKVKKGNGSPGGVICESSDVQKLKVLQLETALPD